MTGTPTTAVHRGPDRPGGPAGRPALICVFPEAVGLPLPDSGQEVGRQWLAAAGLADSEVSGAHLAFDQTGGRLRVEDLGSRNGTWLDGQRLSPGEPVEVADGAILRLGRTLFVIRQALIGPLEPSPPLGAMVGPFGLRGVARELDGIARQKPRTVLIEGETGTGKELCARVVAKTLERAEPYAPVNVAGIAQGVFESQLFGHVAGAFSGAGEASDGIVKSHDGGTVVLDEIGELALDLQAKLLRLVDNREIMPVGAARPRTVDVLLLAATHRDLEDMSATGDFRADLYARLASARLILPSLRDRPEDVFTIATHLAELDGQAVPPEAVEVEAVERLCLCPWPRNVRQLRATLAAAAREDPTPGLRLWSLERQLGPAPVASGTLTLAAAKRALASHGGNVTAAAAALDVSRGKLLRFRKKHDL